MEIVNSWLTPVLKSQLLTTAMKGDFNPFIKPTL